MVSRHRARNHTRKVESERRRSKQITLEALERARKIFKRREDRGPMYRVARVLLRKWWGQFGNMADALSVLLLTWNNAFYRYGGFDRRRLQKWLRTNWGKVQRYRRRKIGSLTDQDAHEVRSMFRTLNEALQIRSGKKRGTKSPVATVKALHLLAPEFFPLWDKKIALAYGCDYSRNPARAYSKFCKQIRHVASGIRLGGSRSESGKSVLKLLDEYNYVRYTKRWHKRVMRRRR